MKRNLTLTLDRDLLQAARRVALERDTSVNQLVREYLTGLVKERESRQAAIADMNDIVRACKITLGPIIWTRDDPHER